MELLVPKYYIVQRGLPDDEIPPVLNALRITPCSHVIISDLYDAVLAAKLGDEIVRVSTDEDALKYAYELAEEIHRPVLVIGEAKVLDAVYEDLRKEEIRCQSRTAQS